MKAKITQTKVFVVKHRGAILGITGLLVGIAVTHHYHGINHGTRWGIAITKEQLQGMLDDPTMCLNFESGCGEKFALSQIDLSQVKH